MIASWFDYKCSESNFGKVNKGLPDAHQVSEQLIHALNGAGV